MASSVICMGCFVRGSIIELSTLRISMLQLIIVIIVAVMNIGFFPFP